MNPLSPTLLVASIAITAIIFAGVAFLSRAGMRRIAGVLLAAIPVIPMVMCYDGIASRFGWWRYPSVAGGNAPLAWYVAAALGYGAAFGLVGWRVIRRWEMRGLLVFILLFASSAWHVTTDTARRRISSSSDPAQYHCWPTFCPTVRLQRLCSYSCGGSSGQHDPMRLPETRRPAPSGDPHVGGSSHNSGGQLRIHSSAAGRCHCFVRRAACSRSPAVTSSARWWTSCQPVSAGAGIVEPPRDSAATIRCLTTCSSSGSAANSTRTTSRRPSTRVEV